MLALDRRILDTPLEERFAIDLVAWAKAMFPVIRHSISEARQSESCTWRSLPRQHQSLPQTVSAPVHPPLASDFGRQEPSPLRLQPTLAGPDITTSVLISPPRQRQNQPRKNRPLPQPVPCLVYALRNRL
jgi:hypothetical protein